MIDPKDFRALADGLVADTDDEATWRTAAGRWYYSSFLQAKTKLGLPHTKIVPHIKVQKECRTTIDPRMGDDLKSLYFLRKKADYRPDLDFNEDDRIAAMCYYDDVAKWI